MRPRIVYTGVNEPDQARRLADMIIKATRKIVHRDSEKVPFIEATQKKEAEFLAEGFDRA